MFKIRRQLIFSIKLEIDDRAECLARKNAFITLKDHKENFDNSRKCRLVNPAKSEIGRVSKQIAERINTCIKHNTGLNQWKNTSDVIQWFKNIEEKSLHSFIQFDIVEFYPSISEELLMKALDYGKKFTNISTQELQIIMHSKRSLLFENDVAWVKKGDSGEFDVTMGSLKVLKHAN